MECSYSEILECVNRTPNISERQKEFIVGSLDQLPEDSREKLNLAHIFVLILGSMMIGIEENYNRTA